MQNANQSKPTYDELVATLKDIVQELPYAYYDEFQGHYLDKKTSYFKWKDTLCRSNHGDSPCTCERLIWFDGLFCENGAYKRGDLDDYEGWFTLEGAKQRAGEILRQEREWTYFDFIEVYEGHTTDSDPAVLPIFHGAMTKTGWCATRQELDAKFGCVWPEGELAVAAE